ncbi:MAG: FtsX-like permease family protein [Candidatus Bathyarchaeota archaeon]
MEVQFTTRFPEKGSSQRRRLFFKSLFPIIIFLLIIGVSVHPKAQALEPTILRGEVRDAETGLPIENATVAIWEYKTVGREFVPSYKKGTKTDVNGSYTISFEDKIQGRACAYYDNLSTPGYDYLPRFQNFFLGSSYGLEANILFELIPAASVRIDGDIRFVDSSKSYSSYSFTVISENESLSLAGNILTYGPMADSFSRFINVDPNLVIIPAHTALHIEMKASTPTSNHTVILTDSQLFSLSKGDRIAVNPERYLLPYNLNFTQETLHFAEKLVDELEQKDFYVQAEKVDLEIAFALIENAEKKLVQSLYEESYADLRESYTKIVYIINTIPSMYTEARTSTIFIIIFLSLTATALSHFFFEHWAKKVVGIALFNSTFLIVFFYVYAGCRLIPISSFLLAASLSTLISLIIFLVPQIYPITASTILSLAKNNLKRRWVRFILTVVPIIALVLGFVTLTSFSTQYGFTSTIVGTTQSQSESLLIRQPLPEIPPIDAGTRLAVTFNPLEISAVDWLKLKAEVTLAAPKVENYPSRDSLGSLSIADRQLRIFGILGILPSAEAQVTSFNNLVVGQGRYLNDTEDNGIMISVDAAKTLNVQIGERLTLSTRYSTVKFTLIGLLDDGMLRRITDLDGSLLLPKKVVIEIQDETLLKASIDPCEPSEIVVINWQTAPRLLSPSSSLTFLSRIDALAAGSVDLLSFARKIALEQDYWIWATSEGRINLMGLTQYLETKGTSVFIPWIIVIFNVIMTMINAVYERRKEVIILSSVGLNPTDITFLFGAEALIIGVIGGGVGYLLGLSLYKFLPLLSTTILVRQKISAAWSLASLGIAVAAVLVGAFIALRYSVIITPSLLRKWKNEGKQSEKKWLFELPARVPKEEVSSLIDYIKSRLPGYYTAYDIKNEAVKQIEMEPSDSVHQKISFTSLGGHGLDSFVSYNQIFISHVKGGKNYTLSLVCDASEKNNAYKIASFMRRFFLEWSAMKKGNANTK